MKIVGRAALGIVGLAVLGAGWLFCSAQASAKSYAEDQLRMAKPDEELLGTRLEVPREGETPVRVNVYIPESEDALPVVFNLHGGAFIGGNADLLDTQSDRIAKNWNAMVVTVQYSLAKDGVTIEDGTREIVDVIRYFRDHAQEYHADPERFCVLGYSAGGYHAMAAVLALKPSGIDVAAQVLCYPYLGDALETYNTLSQAQKASIAPALFVFAGRDPIGEGSLPYEEALAENGVVTAVKRWDEAAHGFLEENNPEYERLNNKPSKSPEQERMAREAEAFIGNWLQTQWAH